MHVLVAVASRYGSTRGIAEAIARKLRARDHAVDLRTAGDAPDAGVLKREPPQDRGDAPRLLRFLERGVAEPRGVEQELEQRAL